MITQQPGHVPWRGPAGTPYTGCRTIRQPNVLPISSRMYISKCLYKHLPSAVSLRRTHIHQDGRTRKSWASHERAEPSLINLRLLHGAPSKSQEIRYIFKSDPFVEVVQVPPKRNQPVTRRFFCRAWPRYASCSDRRSCYGGCCRVVTAVSRNMQSAGAKMNHADIDWSQTEHKLKGGSISSVQLRSNQMP
jgi:hypothetical protein